MNKQIVRHFQSCDFTISSLRTKIRQMGSVENRHHADRPHKTTRREDIDNVTSFRRNRFLFQQGYLAWLEMPRELGFVPKQFKDD